MLSVEQSENLLPLQTGLLPHAVNPGGSLLMLRFGHEEKTCLGSAPSGVCVLGIRSPETPSSPSPPPSWPSSSPPRITRKAGLMTEQEELRYPIGRFSPPESSTPGTRAAQ